MALLPLLLNILVLALVLWLCWYVIGLLPIPETPKKIIGAIILVIAVLYLLQLILPMAGAPRSLLQ